MSTMVILFLFITLIASIAVLIWSVFYLVKGPKKPFFYGYAMVDTADIVPAAWRVVLDGAKVNIIYKKHVLHSFDVIDIADIEAKHNIEPDKIIEKDKNMLLRAAAGGLLFGGAGAVIGAMTAIKPSKQVIKGKKDTFILIALRDGKRFVLKPMLGYEYGFNNFCKKFRLIQRLGVTEASVS